MYCVCRQVSTENTSFRDQSLPASILPDLQPDTVVFRRTSPPDETLCANNTTGTDAIHFFDGLLCLSDAWLAAAVAFYTNAIYGIILKEYHDRPLHTINDPDKAQPFETERNEFYSQGDPSRILTKFPKTQETLQLHVEKCC